MRLSTRLIAIIAAASLAAAPAAALARTSSVGQVAGTVATNVCLFMVDCTYVNFARGKPANVIKHNGTIVSWRALQCGALQLRVLRSTSTGRFKFVRSSLIEPASATGVNTFSAHIPVRRGDVLALRDAGASTQSSCLMFADAGPGHSVHYYRPSPLDDATAGPNASTATDQSSNQGDVGMPHLRVLFSATVQG